MQNTCCRKKLIHTLVALATLLVAHTLLPQLVQAQYDPKEEDIIWERELGNGDEVLSSHFIDSERLLVANRDKAEIRSTVDGSLLESAPSSHFKGFSPNKTRTKFASFVRDSVYIWNVETLAIETIIPITSSNIQRVAISESGKYVGVIGGVVPGSSRQYMIWDTETLEQVYLHEEQIPAGNDIVFSGDTLAALSEIGTHLYDLRTKKKTIVASSGSLKFSPDGKWLVRGKYNQNAPLLVDVVNVKEKKLVQSYDDFEFQHRDVSDLRFSLDGTKMYLRLSFDLYIFSFPDMKLTGVFQYVYGGYDISPDARQVASGNYLLTLDNVTSVNDAPTDGILSIIPNPVVEQSIISLPSQGAKYTEVQLITLEGEVVGTIFNSVVSEQIAIPFSLSEYPHLANGQYFLHMIADGQPQESLPFIIQR